MLREYLKLSRFFNMGLTGIAPVLGALSLWDVGKPSCIQLGILFSIGCLAHVYGFVLNDVFDVSIDRLSPELLTRPLVQGSITKTKALWFAVLCLIFSFTLSVFFFSADHYFLLLLFVLACAFFLATIYDLASKRFPGMDFFVASAVFFLIFFGAMAVGVPSLLTWIVALIGGLQVVFMNMINGSIKDIDHDSQGSANTLAIRLGARIHEGTLSLPWSFKVIGYLIEGIRSGLLFLPFFLILLPYQLWQLAILCILTMCSFYLVHRLFSVQRYERRKIRKHIGMIVIIMYATTPVMLSSLNIFIILIAVVPPLWFIFSNMILHRTVLEAKTM